MITKHTTTAIALAAALCVGALHSFAAPESREDAASSGSSSSSPAASPMLSGEIASASPTSVTITDNKSGTSKSVTLTSTTVITINGRAAKASELKAGQLATVSFEQKEGLNVAVSVSART